MAAEDAADSSDLSKLMGEFQIADLDFVRHNETDFEAFRDFSQKIDERYKEREKAKELEAKRKNLMLWLNKVPDRWRTASFRGLKENSIAAPQSAIEAAKRMIRNRQRGFYISGPHTTGKSYLAYAMIREFVAHGKLKQSQIKVITEGDLLSMANGGYETRDAFDALFDPRFKCYLFDSIGTRKEYDEKREAPALTKLIEEAYNRSALFIATSHMGFELYESGLPEQAAAKLRHMVQDGVIYTGQPLYGKNDERRDQVLDVDLFNAEGKISFSEEDPAPAKKTASARAKPKSGSGSWKDTTRKIKD